MIFSAFSIILLYTMLLNEITKDITARHYKIQIVVTLIGVFSALIIAGINYKYLRKTWPLYVIPAFILQSLAFTPLAYRVDDDHDLGWIDLGFTTLQPAEFLKIAFILSFAAHLAYAGKNINKIHRLVLLCGHIAPFFGILIILKDSGDLLVFGVMIAIMIFAAGIDWRYIAAGLAAVPIMAFFAWNYFLKPFQKKRIQVIFDEEFRESEMRGLYYQQYKSITAIGSGGISGQGLTGGQYTVVSVVESDFIFAYIGMTLGFTGCLIVILGLVILCFMILNIASKAKDEFGRLICVGVFSLIFAHSVVNIAMATAAGPVVGIPLPFISAGGTSGLALYFCIGLVLSVYAHRGRKKHMFYEEEI